MDAYMKKYIHELQQKALDEGKVFWPETPETLFNQYERVLVGKKAAMLFHMLREDSLPPELLRPKETHTIDTVDTDVGTFFFNTTLVGKRDVLHHFYKGTLGILLGYGIPSVPEEVEGTFALRLVNKSGVEKECVCVREQDIEKVTDALMEFYEEGDVIIAQTREEFRAERLSRFKLTNGEEDEKQTN